MYTTWKKRGSYEARHTIDYVWHSPDKLRPTARLGVVDAADMEPWRLPGFRYPSDHLSLWARFELVGSEARGGPQSGEAGGRDRVAGTAGAGIARASPRSGDVVGFGLKRPGGGKKAGSRGGGGAAGSTQRQNASGRSGSGSSASKTWAHAGKSSSNFPAWQPEPYNGGHGTPSKPIKHVNSAGSIREHRKGSTSSSNGGGSSHASGTRMRHGSSSSSFRSESGSRQRPGSTSSRGSSTGGVDTTYFRGSTAGRTWSPSSPPAKPAHKHSDFPVWMPEPYTGGHGVPPPGAMAETRAFADPASRGVEPRGGLGTQRGTAARKQSESGAASRTLRTLSRSASSGNNVRSTFTTSRRSTDLDNPSH